MSAEESDTESLGCGLLTFLLIIVFIAGVGTGYWGLK